MCSGKPQADGFAHLDPKVLEAMDKLVSTLCKGGFIPDAHSVDELLADVSELAVEMKEDLDPEFLAQVLRDRDHVVAILKS